MIRLRSSATVASVKVARYGGQVRDQRSEISHQKVRTSEIQRSPNLKISKCPTLFVNYNQV